MKTKSPSPSFTAARVILASAGFIFLTILVGVSLPTSVSSKATPQQSEAAKKPAPLQVPGEILIRFKDDSEARKATTIAGTRTSISVAVNNRQIPIQIERLDGGKEIVPGLRLARIAPADLHGVLVSLNERNDVVYAEPNYRRFKEATPNDPRFQDMWNLKNPGGFGTGTLGADIKAEQAWNITKGSRNVVVAVIDEGIDISHQDLQANIWTNPGEIAGNGIDDDSNGFVDDVHGYDFVHNDSSVFDGPGNNPDGSVIDAHGTHVAGTVGAVGNNGIGVVGVNWEVSLMSLKFLSPNGGSTADAIRALGYARMMRELWVSSNGTKGANVRITNNSYGGAQFSQAESDAIHSSAASGLLFVAAAGNESANNDLIPSYPANYDLPNVISVASTDRFDRISNFSNYGWGKVHIAAPGSGILSTLPGNNYGVNNGTSMASPHVAGAAALVLAEHPDFSISRLRASLLFGGAEVTALSGLVETGNRLDAAGSLQNAAEVDSTPPAPINDLQLLSVNGRTVTLSWTSPGDDGNNGRAVLNEIRFTDQTSGKIFLVGVATPAPAGTQHVANINVPYQHTDGTINLITFDNAGNSSSANVAVHVDPIAANPYEITLSAAEPLSTGGTPLEANFDDKITQFSLPFVFPFFENNTRSLFAQGSTSGVFFSTNGALYMAGSAIPNHDASSSIDQLTSWKMIAGLWDDLDLRTSQRSDAGLFVVQPDPSKIIFRWQGVPCNR